jgi:RNA:NAD 2'-phosphotransferase (TPT1/KptA family)
LHLLGEILQVGLFHLRHHHSHLLTDERFHDERFAPPKVTRNHVTQIVVAFIEARQLRAVGN